MCAMQSSRTSAVGQLCFYGQTEKGIFCLFRGQEELENIYIYIYILLKNIIFFGAIKDVGEPVIT